MESDTAASVSFDSYDGSLASLPDGAARDSSPDLGLHVACGGRAARRVADGAGAVCVRAVMGGGD